MAEILVVLWKYNNTLSQKVDVIMQWITCDEAPIKTKDNQMVAIRYKDYFGDWRYTEGEYCDGWHIWHPEETRWIASERCNFSSQFEWLLEE